MSDREKLVELLSGVQAGGVALDHEALKANAVQNEEVAEYLITHGVTVREQQKPLTVEEATGTLDIVWFEQKHGYATHPCDAVIAPDCVNVNMSMIGHSVPLVRPIKDYGKTWRCWAEKPTDEERKAAEWEK